MSAADQFRAAVEADDIEAGAAAMTPDVVLNSPIAFRPFEGREAVTVVLGAVKSVFGDFRYETQSASEDGRDHVLVFRTSVGEREVHGADFLHLDEDGAIDRLDVMVRPLSAANALAEAMSAKLAELGFVKA